MNSSYKDLDVYKLTIDFVTILYACTAKFPKEEQFGLVSQMRRAAVSIPSNIAEGAARQGNKEFIHFLYIALGSKAELETQLIIASNLHFISEVDYEHLQRKLDEIGKMLGGLIRFRKSLMG